MIRFLVAQLLYNKNQSSVCITAERKIEKRDNGLFITIVHKVFNTVFLFVGLTTLGVIFDW